jgi:hypothetical protein
LNSFLAALDRQGEVTTAARLTARYLLLGHPVDALVATLARSVLREDAGFHVFRMLEAGVRPGGAIVTLSRAPGRGSPSAAMMNGFQAG